MDYEATDRYMSKWIVRGTTDQQVRLYLNDHGDVTTDPKQAHAWPNIEVAERLAQQHADTPFQHWTAVTVPQFLAER